jgi:dienelactone hydrolase
VAAGISFGLPGPSPPPRQHDAPQHHHVRSGHSDKGKAPIADPPAVGVWRSYRVGSRWVAFDEPSYTASNGAVIGARRLLTQIRYPLARQQSKTTRPATGPFPMIVFAPGFMQCGAPYSDLLHYWATAGYVVVVVNFPYSDCLVGSPTENDMLNQPHDMSYVITRMLALSRSKRGPFSGLLNPKQIAIAGQSDGGDTVAAIAANTCCTDRRVKAVAVESGAEWPAMRGSYFTAPVVPILFSQGSADTINPAGCSVTLYDADKARPNFFLYLLGASHTGPYWGTDSYEQVVARVTLAFFDRYVLHQERAGRTMRLDADIPGLASLSSDGQGQLPAAIPGLPCY